MDICGLGGTPSSYSFFWSKGDPKRTGKAVIDKCETFSSIQLNIYICVCIILIKILLKFI